MLRKPGKQRDGFQAFLEEVASICSSMKRIVELGSYAGETAEMMVKKFPDAKLFCIDPWSDIEFEIYPRKCRPSYKPSRAEADFDLVCQRFANITKIKSTSMEQVGNFEDNLLDMVYIDALHTPENIREDLEGWIPKVRLGGIISGHDYNVKFRSYKLAIFNYFGRLPTRFPDSSWYYLKDAASNPGRGKSQGSVMAAQ